MKTNPEFERDPVGGGHRLKGQGLRLEVTISRNTKGELRVSSDDEIEDADTLDEALDVARRMFG